MSSVQALVASSPNPEVENQRFNLNQMQKPTYQFIGGYKIYCEMCTIKITIPDIGNFDPRILVASQGFESATPRELVDVSCKVISTASKMALSHALGGLEQENVGNFEKQEISIPLGGFTLKGKVEIEALPEYAPGDSGKKAIDIFREKNGRDPTDNIIESTKFTPVFGFSGN